MRFHYPVYYIIGLAASFIFCGFASIFSFLYEPNHLVALGFTLASLVSLYELNEMTHSIWIDEQGIRLDSIFGEIKNFSWDEIINIKQTGFFSPGVKVTSQPGESISISSLFVKYDLIIELIHHYSKVSWGKDELITVTETGTNSTKIGPHDLHFEGKSWRWISVPMYFAISAFFFYISLKTDTMLYIIIGGAFLVVLFPGYVYVFFREPILIETKDDNLMIKFRSDIFREPIQVKAGEINDILLKSLKSITSHGAIHPSTNLEIILFNHSKVKVENFSTSNEEMYMKLSTWLVKHRDNDNHPY